MNNQQIRFLHPDAGQDKNLVAGLHVSIFRDAEGNLNFASDLTCIGDEWAKHAPGNVDDYDIDAEDDFSNQAYFLSKAVLDGVKSMLEIK
jgi:hypothetical protein